MSATASQPVITFFDSVSAPTGAEVEGTRYSGVAQFADGSTAKISIQMSSQLFSEVTGTALLDAVRPGDPRHLFVLRGTATRAGMFNLRGVATGNCTAIVNGVMSRDGSQATGQFVVTALGKTPTGGTFTASRQ